MNPLPVRLAAARRRPPLGRIEAASRTAKQIGSTNGHAEISLTLTGVGDECTDEQRRAAMWAAAGKLAMLYALAEPWVRYARHLHRCDRGATAYNGTEDLAKTPEWWLEVHDPGFFCDVSAWDVLTPTLEEEECASMWIYIPSADLKLWQGRVAHWLRAIDEAEGKRR